VNPEVDTVLRGKKAYRKGDAFKTQGEQVDHGSRPSDATRALAVDLVALTGRNDDTFTSVLREWVDDAPGLHDHWTDVDKLLSLSSILQIANYAAKGLRKLIVVVGNDDDASEVTFVQPDNNELNGILA
jgi:hypothetical protein